MGLVLSCPSAEGHGHLLKATVRPGQATSAQACAANAPAGTCPPGNTLSMRRLIPRSGNDGVCAIPPGCVLGCPNQQGALPGGPPCASEGICDHCALEKTSGEKAIVGGDGSKWWTKMPAAHWDEPDQWPKYPCMSNDAFGARGTASVKPGDAIETVMYVNADHSGLYRFEMSCGEAATNANFNAAPVTAWKALHASKELAPGAAPLAAGRDVGYTRAETDAYWDRTICTAATCAYRMNGAQPQYPGGAYDINSAECQQGILGVQCFITDTFTLPAGTACRGAATLRWMWNSAEGPETYANCLDLTIEGSAVGGEPGGGGGGGGRDQSLNGDSNGGNAVLFAAAAVIVVGLVGALVYRNRTAICAKRSGAAPSIRKHDSADPRWAVAAAVAGQPPPPPPPPGQDALPPGWQAVTDPATKHTYFYNATTGATTWERPGAATDSYGMEMQTATRV